MLKRVIRSAGIGFFLITFSIFLNAQTPFPGTGVGPIPDGPSPTCGTPGVPLVVSFNVSGIAAAPSNVSVDMTFSPVHTWGADIVATLRSPDGTAFLIFGQTGGLAGGGDNSDLAGPYSFNDAAAGNWWTAALAAGATTAIPSGSYRTSTIGSTGTSGGAVTSINPAFAGIPTSNGTWTLTFTDGCAGDPGGVGSAVLTLTGSGTGIVLQKPNVDLDGDGFSDYVVIREVDTLDSTVRSSNRRRVFSSRERLRQRIEELGKRTEGMERINSPSATQMVWYTLSSVSGATSAASWGDYLIDTAISADFDGDETDDYIVWRPFTEFDSAAFYWINSSNNTFNTDPFGLETDDPSVVGDWDGDGVDDRATYRCPLPGEGAGPCYFFSRQSSNPGNTGFNPLEFGFGEVFDFVPCPADYDGDETMDACIQRENPNVPGNGQFVLRRSSDGGVEFVDWGAPSDFVIPGDYDGDGKSDFCVRRNVGGTFVHFILERDGGGTGGSGIHWGFSTDVSVPGDYDGDGIQDIAVWRPSDGNFWVQRSTGGFSAVSWGLGSLRDAPVADWYVH